MFLESQAYEVLNHYPAGLRGTLVFLGTHGGFSGAHLWHLTAPAGIYCLKAWPPDWRAPADLAWIHSLMARAATLPWMPRIIPVSQGASYVDLHGRLWEIATWMPGRADFTQTPSRIRLEAASTALAQLHQAWRDRESRHPCPAVQRRLDSWRTWHDLLQSGWRPVWDGLDPYMPVTEELWRLVLEKQGEVPRHLAPWRARLLPLQPCVCDLWHDHVLFTGAAVTGLIDFGSLKQDHVAVDLARLLGSLVGADAELWEAGLSAYHEIRPLTADERALASVLDRTGTILAATHWLRWLYLERRKYEHPGAVRIRLMHLVQRLRDGKEKKTI
jgi:Ser/Thr protein kinase RdoA (MazF antagonist)